MHYRTSSGKSRCGIAGGADELASLLDDVDCDACKQAIEEHGGDPLRDSAGHRHRVWLTHVEGGAVYRTPFSPYFVDRLKAEIPAEERRWRRHGPKGWFVSTSWRDLAEQVIRAAFSPKELRGALHLLGLAPTADPALVYLAHMYRSQAAQGDAEVIHDLERAILSISVRLGEDVLARGREELLELGVLVEGDGS